MSNVVFHSTDMRWGGSRGGVRVQTRWPAAVPGGRFYPCPAACSETAENLRRQYGIPRAPSRTSLVVASHQRGGCRAAQRGVFAEEIILVTVLPARGSRPPSTPTSIRAPTPPSR